MQFETYFKATEEAFAQEKEAALDKILGLKKCWQEVQELDNKVIEKCNRMSEVKRLVNKSHMQILRTKEECLQMQLKNAQLRFHVRQLQNEIFRLLPFSHTQVPSTEYIMSLDRDVFKAQQHSTKSEADEEHMVEIKKLHKMWSDLVALQKRVFTEEKNQYEEDAAQWKKFSTAVENQSKATHKIIDTYLNQITMGYGSLKRQDDEDQEKQKNFIQELEKKINKLSTKSKTLTVSLEAKKEADKKKTTRISNKITRELQRRIQSLQNKNGDIIEDMQDENDDLYEKEDILLDDLDEINEKIKKYQSEIEGLTAEGEERLENLEAQLNALISAASGINIVPKDQHVAIVGAVAAAVSMHGCSATKAERTNTQLENLRYRYGLQTPVYD
ncbi:hypothetical protein TVAG_444500 [Trichomonas vaginalis G3]|uniref:Uncharacterized protein n=1 Tax=Trichomonas vaginalis (strain ATCC PRA-98 / G3) TaxID=412133 RepID=A2E2J1_TRIV3|nr:hypothetical protein TVAGG3_0306290 [Trichomonas vaginalis G3]EAY13166.1 hypothetical protein TVAG_444500 [Trichomonas vaginalis G3]KAI5528279.1 hypothetical protein TVAGG3_0306290 [Trichomonas vaginalis G3]|eukprot:XP_001325389.1 hypothetical protein [Trichomonas vaginalis G3]